MHENLKQLYRLVLAGIITPAEYDEVVPSGTPKAWLEYLRRQQFSPGMLPRLFHPLGHLFDKPPGHTDNPSEHNHRDYKRASPPTAPTDILAFTLGPPTGSPGGFMHGKWARRRRILLGLEDLSQYTARTDLTGHMRRGPAPLPAASARTCSCAMWG